MNLHRPPAFPQPAARSKNVWPTAARSSRTIPPTAAKGVKAKLAANWVMGDLAGALSIVIPMK